MSLSTKISRQFFLPTELSTPSGHVQVKFLGRVPYEISYQAMREFAGPTEELWLLEHDPVYTLGQAGRSEHLHCPVDSSQNPPMARIASGAIPLVRTDRGGQITYHGPGQLVAYTLFDLSSRRLKVREYVRLLEQILLDTLAVFSIDAKRLPGAPGIYVQDKKIAALGLRIRAGRCYHGVSLNVMMNLAPFQSIDPCGFANLGVAQIADFVADISLDQVTAIMVQQFQKNLS